MQLFSADTKLFSKQLIKTPSKDAQKNSNPLVFPYYPELPKRVKQQKSCPKIWLTE